MWVKISSHSLIIPKENLRVKNHLFGRNLSHRPKIKKLSLFRADSFTDMTFKIFLHYTRKYWVLPWQALATFWVWLFATTFECRRQVEGPYWWRHQWSSCPYRSNRILSSGGRIWINILLLISYRRDGENNNNNWNKGWFIPALSMHAKDVHLLNNFSGAVVKKVSPSTEDGRDFDLYL